MELSFEYPEAEEGPAQDDQQKLRGPAEHVQYFESDVLLEPAAES